MPHIPSDRNPTGRHIVMEGMLVGVPDDFPFDPKFPHTYCRLCGAVFQSSADRKPHKTPAQAIKTTLKRKQWSYKHAETHPQSHHDALAASGSYMTPEAAFKLIPLGIIPVSDMILDPATEQAGTEAPRFPEVPLHVEGGH